MKRIDTQKLKYRGTVPTYGFIPQDGILDGTLKTIATEYLSTVRKAYKYVNSADIERVFGVDTQWHISTKYDGEGVFIYFDEEGAFAFNGKSGRVRLGFPALIALYNKTRELGYKSGLLCAELYLEGVNGIRGTVSDVISATFSGKVGNLRLGIYDILMLDGKDYRIHRDDYLKVYTDLCKFGEDADNLYHMVSGKLISSSEILNYFTTICAQGMEGTVVRSLGRMEIFKVKPQLSIDAGVIGYVADEIEGNTVVTSLLLGLSCTAGIQEFCRIGSGIDTKLGIKLYECLATQHTACTLLKTDSDGRQIHFVKPSLIVEVRGDSLEVETLSGRSNETPLYEYSSGFNYKCHRTIPRVSFPTLARLREDKSIDAKGDWRIEQICNEPSQVLQEKLSPSILFKRTATKGEAIRQLLIIQPRDSTRPKLLALYTDYSKERATPLAQDYYIAEDYASIKGLVLQHAIELTKRGWTITEDIEETYLHEEQL